MARSHFELLGNKAPSNGEAGHHGLAEQRGQQVASRFRLRRASAQASTVEWAFGNEDDARFQLRATAPSPPSSLVGDRAVPTPSARVNHYPEFSQWQRPVPSVSTGAPSAPLEGEIVSPATTDTVAAPRYRRSTAAPPAPTQSNLLTPFVGEEGLRRVLAVRIALDEALDRWWTNGEHASTGLLRDGLLVLEAGHDLDETQRSFLLRTALRARRGMVTALRYQLDADRTAFLLKEALLDTKHPFDPTLVDELRRQDEQSAEWLDYLTHDLTYEATVATGKRSQLAAAALQAIQSPSAPRRTALGRVAPSPVAAPVPLLRAVRLPQPFTPRARPRPLALRPLSHQWSLRWLLWGALSLLLLLRMGQPLLVSATPLVAIPAGTYVVSDPTSRDGRFREVTLAAYAIERHEITNRDYRRCWEAGGCPIPSSFDSQSRPGYFANHAYDDFPVVNVSWEAANTYCTWVGRRLPTLEEWEVAASLAPATGLRYSYPWGERFDQRLANSALSELQDTGPVGAYHPAGSTPLGIMDLAGNVAEWTAMPATSMLDGGVVKGGSFRDPPDQLRNDAFVELPRSTSAPWLGFRCATAD